MPDMTPEEITTLIRESGYLMEQEVASCLEDLGFIVQTNWAFQDQDEGKSRELDAKAFLLRVKNEDARVYLCVEILCECKNATNPLIFIGRNKSPRDAHHVPAEFVFPFENYRKEQPDERPNTRSFFMDPPWRHLELAPHHYFYSHKTKAVQFCRVCRNGKKVEVNHGGLFESLVYPIVKAVVAKRAEMACLNKDNESKTTTLLFPLVVTNSPLYYLNSQAETPVVEAVQQVSLLRHVDSKTVQGEFLVDFVRQEFLAEFVTTKLMPFVDVVAQLAEERPRLFREDTIPLA